ncbi:uncharacterized protein FIBRA_02911 [Fibroporia radiculosa]|uniref:F-box domain-containing protein n=1 Tax=Fibroporia radiculosa TaxID=599839 RepID=J4GN68_9APHY|nr:uncharacterized protein FIBRA_02911 [Fibroporia radiculosa]CCM00865.1 predicted protein [Fibroporia radiculosa]
MGSIGPITEVARSEPDMRFKHLIQLPVELWEKVIDCVADDWMGAYRDNEVYEARLLTLGRVCRGWYSRCRFRAQERLDVRDTDKSQVYRLIKVLNKHPERCRPIKAVSFDWWNESVAVFGTFAICMAQKLPRVELLRFENGVWVVGQLHTQIFLHVTLAFGSVTILDFFSVKFPSAVVFGRLVRALPRLASLYCHQVHFEKRCDVASTVWVRHPLRLDTVDLHNSNDVIDFLASSDAHVRHLSSRNDALEKCSKLLPVVAESLLSLRIALERYFGSPTDARPSDFQIDLTPAVRLQALSFNLRLEDMIRAANILSRASLPKLIEVKFNSLLYDAKSPLVQDALDNVDNNCYALMDQALSGRRYPALQSAVFHLHFCVRRSSVKEVMPKDSWESQLSSRFPSLHASGRLV